MIEIDLNILHKGEKRIHVKATPKRKAHYRTIKEGKSSEATESTKGSMKSPEDVTKKIADYTTSGKVDLPGASIEVLNGILEGLDNVLGRHGAKVNTIGFKSIDAIGLYDSDENSIYFNKDNISSVKDDAKVVIESFKRYTNEDIEEQSSFLAGTLSPKTRQGVEDRISRLKSIRSANVMCDVASEDVVAVVMTHEAYHSIYFTNKKVESEWNRLLDEKMEEVGVRDLNHLPQALSVSEYGAYNSPELFAETGAALTYGSPISDEIKDIFNTVLERINK